MTKEEKVAIQRQQMSNIMNYFKNNQLDFKDTGLLDKMQSSIQRIFQVEIEELGYSYQPNREDSQNTFGLKFINDSNETFRGQCSNSDDRSSITYNIAHLYTDLQSPDESKRLLACKTLFKTVFHEIQHHRQYLMAKSNVSSKEAISYARDFSLQGYLEKNWYSRDGKTGNYDAYTIENNANEVGYRQYLETMGFPDKEITDLMNIERGKLNISRYKADVNSWDGQSHYDSKGLQERDDVTTSILDDLISVRGRTEILQRYPTLQKEYNLDGSKKSPVELIKNMQQEIVELSNNKDLLDKEKTSLIKDGQAMYYELIYRQIEKSTPEQLSEISRQIGKDESKEIFGEMYQYFQVELEGRLGKSATMAQSQMNLGNQSFIMPSNSGTIAVKQNGNTMQVAFDDFIKTIDPKLLQKTFLIPAGKEKGEMTAKRFVEKYLFGKLSENGMMTLKDGTKITAKQFIEHTLETYELKESYPPNKYIMDTIQSETPWDIHQKNRERLETYYDGKKKIVSDVSKQVEEYDPAKVDEQMQKRIAAHQRKMQWVKNFVKDYEDTEQGTSYALRANSEDENIKRVLESIKAGHFLEEYDNNASSWKNNPEMYMGKIIPAMARLIKEADNLTIDGSEDYMEKFVSIPEVNKILLQIRDSEVTKQMHSNAEENRKNGNIPRHHRTIAEVDKQYAQDYLKSGNLSQSSIQDEIKYRRGLTRNDRIRISDEKDTRNITMRRKQQISLTRVIARQDGKVPSKALYDEKKGWYAITDTQQRNQNITPKTITADTKDMGLQEINIAIQQTKQQQINNEEQQISK